MTDARINIRLSEIEKATISKLAEMNNMTETEYIIYRTLTCNPQNPDNKEKKYSYELPQDDEYKYYVASVVSEIKTLLSAHCQMEYKEEWAYVKNEVKTATTKFLRRHGLSRIKNED